jgi:hypothetical protein
VLFLQNMAEEYKGLTFCHGFGNSAQMQARYSEFTHATNAKNPSRARLAQRGPRTKWGKVEDVKAEGGGIEELGTVTSSNYVDR